MFHDYQGDYYNDFINDNHRNNIMTLIITITLLIIINVIIYNHFDNYDLLNIHQLQLLVDPRTVAKNPWTMYLYYLVTTLTYLHSVCNPILYALTNKNFQDAFRDTFSCCVRRNCQNQQGNIKKTRKRN